MLQERRDLVADDSGSRRLRLLVDAPEKCEVMGWVHLGCCDAVTPIVLALARMVLRGVLPYPDPMRRVRVRRRAHDLAARDLWPQDEAAVTGLDYANVALLRALWLQRETRRAVRTRQREASALLARTSMETCILGLWCLHAPDAVSKLRAAEIKTAPNLLTFVSSTGLIPDALIRQAVRALGETENQLPDVRSMAAQIDKKTGATLAIHLYDVAYRPASQYFTHATSSALLRHVTRERRRALRPANSWVRRAPVRLADACAGLLAGAIADQVGESTELFLRYAEDHAERVLPPLLATIGKVMVRKDSLVGLWRAARQAREVKEYLSRAEPDEVGVEREARLRDLYDTWIAHLDLDDVPPEAIQPIVDHFVAIALAEWDAEHARRPFRRPGAAEPNEA